MKSFKFKTSAAVVALLFVAASQSQAATMDKAAYKDAKTHISADYKANLAACKSMTGNAKDICKQEAEAKEKVAKAELEYSYSNKPADQAKIAKVKADTSYDVAKEKCDDQAGNAKDVCVKEAKAVHVKALADAKLGKEIGAARKEAATDKRDADYKVAIEKCDAFAGDAKTSCVATAKTTFGKN